MKNVILFGGAFDPIHNGHLNMAFFASKTLNADVFFIPAKKSVWKSESAPIGDKINMIKLAIKDYPRFSVNTYEADKKEDVTYSIETVRHFKNELENTKLYFLIGVDQVNEFHRWKECDEIASLAQLIYFHRPGFTPSQTNIDRFHIMELDSGEYYDVASNQIRDLQSLETPLPVIDYILENDLYCIPRFKSYFTDHRYNHSVSVAHVAYEMAKSNNFKTPGKAFLAGLLHDLGKHAERDYATEIMEREFSEYNDMPLWSYHQFVGSYIAKNDFGVVDEDILKSIEFHASGIDEMSDLQKIVYCSDKVDPLRGYDSSKLIKAMNENIETGFLTVLRANIEFIHKGLKVSDNKLTNRCIKYYL